MEYNREIDTSILFGGRFDAQGIDQISPAQSECHRISDGQTSIFLFGRAYRINGKKIQPGEKGVATIIDLYRQSGVPGLSGLDGDFTLIIKSGKKTEILRDINGAGPQVFYTLSVYASHLSFIIGQEHFQVKPDIPDLSFFLRFGFVPPEGTGIQGISKLPAGHLLICENERITTRPVHPASTNHPDIGMKNVNEYVEQFAALHDQAIGDRIEGKNQVAVLLSGGYDSGGNLARLRQRHTGHLQAFTVSFKDNPLTELPHSKQMAEQFGASLGVYEINGSELAGLPQIVNHMGVPFQESGMMINYAAMRMVATSKPDVILGGDGNDQLFGTGAREIGMLAFLFRTGLYHPTRMAHQISRNFHHPLLFNKIDLYARKIINLHIPDQWGFSENHLKVNRLPKNHFPKPVAIGREELYEMKRKQVDIRYTANEVILFKASKMASLFGIPLTFPYMTLAQHEFIDSLPIGFKTFGNGLDWIKGKGISKYLHKLCYRNALPESITQRKKQGGFVPLSVFFRKGASNLFIVDWINQSELVGELLCNKAETLLHIRDTLHRPSRWFWGQQSDYFRLFNLMILSTWDRIFIKGEKASDLSALWEERFGKGFMFEDV